jgi:hypothetical protein
MSRFVCWERLLQRILQRLKVDTLVFPKKMQYVRILPGEFFEGLVGRVQNSGERFNAEP